MPPRHGHARKPSLPFPGYGVCISICGQSSALFGQETHEPDGHPMPIASVRGTHTMCTCISFEGALPQPLALAQSHHQYVRSVVTCFVIAVKYLRPAPCNTQYMAQCSVHTRAQQTSSSPYLTVKQSSVRLAPTDAARTRPGSSKSTRQHHRPDQPRCAQPPLLESSYHNICSSVGAFRPVVV